MHTTNQSQNTTNNAGVPPAPPEAHQEANGTAWASQRGKASLDAAVLVAFANIASAIDEAGDGYRDNPETYDKTHKAYEAARLIGQRDFNDGFHTPSALIQMDKLLMNAWLRGREEASINARQAVAASLGLIDLCAWEDDDYKDWHATCEDYAKQAKRGCGQSFDLYAQRFSASIDASVSRMTEEDRATAIAIARCYGYGTSEEIRQKVAGSVHPCSCSHGVLYPFCPVGCK